jgi:hypothetical protein
MICELLACHTIEPPCALSGTLLLQVIFGAVVVTYPIFLNRLSETSCQKTHIKKSRIYVAYIK